MKKFFRVAGLTLAALLMLSLCLLASTAGDCLPGFLPVGAVPVPETLGESLPAGALAVFDRHRVPTLNRAAVYETADGPALGWVTGEAPLTVAGRPVTAMGTVTLSIGYLGAVLMTLRRLRWVVWGFAAGLLTVCIWYLATARRRRHKKKVQAMLRTFEQTARRWEEEER